MTTTEVTVSEKPFDLSPRTFEQALTFSNYLADSDMVPKDFKGKPGNCLIGMQWGAELGLKPLQALQNIAIINGRPSLWGDAMLGLVRSSPLCEWVVEGWESDGTAFCKAKRRGEPEQVRTFSDADAKTAGLQGKAGPWVTNPKRMKQLRARAFALRDVFTDILRGMAMAEEAIDIPRETDMGMADVVQTPPPPPARPELTPYPQEQFDTNFGAWKAAVQSGRQTADRLIAMVSTKGALSDAQKTAIRNLEVFDASPIDGKPATSQDDPQ
ncbi:MAG: hypothetical protein SHS37scaffold220_18 [Phage 67_12]|nr:MAG: hypothetical protein SHS37scaffold220_18 [Phage 67_12]